MANSRERHSVILALALFLVAFLVVAIFLERRGQEVASPQEPTSFNPAGQGVKALFLLFERQGFAVTRLEAPYQNLDRRYGLVFVIEPLSRPVDRSELTPLRRWVEQGGSLIYSLTSPARPLDPQDPLLGDIAVVSARSSAVTVQPALATSPYTRDITAITAKSDVRIHASVAGKYQTLFADSQGALAVHKKLGEGHVFAITGISASNGEILSSDNALFFLNIAEAISRQKLLAFDEYHHGVGFTGGDRPTHSSVFANLPAPIQRLALHLLGVFAFLVWNSNRRFGRSRTIQEPATPRNAPQFISAVAHLWRQAHAPDVALIALYRKFIRELISPGEANDPTEPIDIVRYGQQRYQLEPEPLAQFIAQCNAVVAGHRISDQEAIRLANQLEQYRRRCHLDRIR